MSKNRLELSATMATYIRRKLGSISDGLAFVVTSGNIGNIRVGLLFPACPWMRSTVTTVTLMLRRKYCLSVSAYGLYGLKESKVMKAKILLLSLATLLLEPANKIANRWKRIYQLKNREHGRKKRVCHERNGGDVTD